MSNTIRYYRCIMKQADVNYNYDTDELSIIFKEVEIPSVFKLDNNVLLEFDDSTLCSIILPNFQNMFKRPIEFGIAFGLHDLKLVDDDMVITLTVNERYYVNIKVNISSLK